MTGPDDGPDPRPVSVAELLARNGTIGAPPARGRRRRRRGNSEAVTVSELTGELPVLDEAGRVAGEPVPASVEPGQTTAEPASTNGSPEPAIADDDPVTYQPRVVEDADYVDPPELPWAVPAEEMSPDSADDDVPVALAEPAADDDLPQYLRARQEPLFGGHTVGGPLLSAPVDASALEDFEGESEESESSGRMQELVQSGLVVLQSILAVVFGAALFIAFDELWKWNNIVALVMSVLVILGLVVAVRIIRKTEDTGSTLIAVAVGALITLGPLALLQTS